MLFVQMFLVPFFSACIIILYNSFGSKVVREVNIDYDINRIQNEIW